MKIEKITPLFKSKTASYVSFRQNSETLQKTTDKNNEKAKASKLMLWATILAGVVAVSIAGYKGKLGKNIKNMLRKPTDTKIKNDINTNVIDWNSPLKFDTSAIGGNYFNKEYFLKDLSSRPIVLNILKELENVTFDDKSVNLMKKVYDKDNIYDLGLRYAIVANNTAKQKGFGGIISEVPSMFKGLEIKELFRKLDDLVSLLDRKKINKFNINGKEYLAEFIGGGCISDVYKITYPKTGERICLKFARQPYLTGRGQGIFDEVAITLEANKAGVVNIPKLYMANPIGRYKTLPDSFKTNHGAWQITEYIEKGKKRQTNGLDLLSWLETKGLEHGDCHDGNLIGDVIIDLGGIIDKDKTIGKLANLDYLLSGYQNGLTTSDIVNKINQSHTT